MGLAPYLSPLGLPEAERDAAGNLTQSLSDLSSFEEKFRLALEMFDSTDKFQLQIPVARDGAMTVFHFAKTFEAIATGLGQKSPTVLSMIDRPKLREARKLLERLFPDFEDLRHSIAHAGELLNEPDGLKKHAANGVFMRDCLSGRQFVNTFGGKFQSYELSQESLDGLREVKRLVYEAFRPASDETRKRAAEKLKAGGP